MSRTGKSVMSPGNLSWRLPIPDSREVFQISKVSAMTLNCFPLILCKINMENMLFPSFLFFLTYIYMFFNTTVNLDLLSWPSSALYVEIVSLTGQPFSQNLESKPVLQGGRLCFGNWVTEDRGISLSRYWEKGKYAGWETCSPVQKPLPSLFDFHVVCYFYGRKMWVKKKSYQLSFFGKENMENCYEESFKHMGWVRDIVSKDMIPV